MISGGDRNGNMNGSLGISHTVNTGSSVPAQVLFMDSQEVASRTHSNIPSSAYYQVATPKSPHELLLDADPNASELHIINGHVENNSETRNTSGDSEEMERLKYETAKSEIMDKLHLHTLINHRETQRIQREIQGVNAQLSLLKKLHDDNGLTKKIELHHEKQNQMKKLELEAINNTSSGYFGDGSSGSFLSGNSSGFSSIGNNSSSAYYYQTRSKSHGNITEIPHLRPANSTIIDLRVTGSKSIPNYNNNCSSLSELTQLSSTTNPDLNQFRSNQMNTHHRRNYSSTCLTSNSGIIGRTEDNQPIFRRYDGVLVFITCSYCGRSGFTSAQGIVNHTRLKHSKTYSSQPLAILNNQTLLDELKQDSEVLEKFKDLGLDPEKDYLPNEVAIPTLEKKSDKKNVVNTVTSFSPTSCNSNVIDRSTKHLEKLYNDKEDFTDLVEMVNEAPKDLAVVIKQSESELELYNQENQVEDKSSVVEEKEDKSPSYTPSPDDTLSSSDESSTIQASTNRNLSPEVAPSPTSIELEPRRSLRKRKVDQDNDMKTIKDRLRPAEKKARPDVVAFASIPEHEKRSSHYNLRAKSKLKAHHNDIFD